MRNQLYNLRTARKYAKICHKSKTNITCMHTGNKTYNNYRINLIPEYKPKTSSTPRKGVGGDIVNAEAH